MILDPILPEIYTFIDFATHDVFTCKKRGEKSYRTHLGGELKEDRHMPYNVYVYVREYLARTPEAVDEVVKYLTDEFSKPNNNFSSVKVTASSIAVKKSFGRTQNYPQIDVSLDWE
ncbi:MAG: hypothetical protein ACI4EV_02460 [Lachnospiraceae bacterium]